MDVCFLLDITAMTATYRLIMNYNISLTNYLQMAMVQLAV